MSVMLQSVATLMQCPPHEVDELQVTIAQYELQGIGPTAIADVFSVDEEQIQEILKDENYQSVKQAVALELAKFSSDADVSWDSLEHKALKNLNLAVQTCPDPEFQLRVAAMANKANRRHRNTSQDVLNPAGAGTRVQLTLTERFVQKLGKGQEKVTERKIDINEADNARIDTDSLSQLLCPKVNSVVAA